MQYWLSNCEKVTFIFNNVGTLEFAYSRGARVQILEVVDTLCYFWLSCILLNL